MLSEGTLIAAAIIAASYNHNVSMGKPNLPMDQMQKRLVEALEIVEKGRLTYLEER